jgi:hypothetical protein
MFQVALTKGQTTVTGVLFARFTKTAICQAKQCYYEKAILISDNTLTLGADDERPMEEPICPRRNEEWISQ